MIPATDIVRKLPGALLVLCAALAAGCAGPGCPAEAVAQKPVVEAFQPHTVQQTAVYDDRGNVIKLAVSNHNAFWDKAKGPPPEPMPEAVFRRVLELKHLQALAIEKQQIGDETYHMLGRLKKLRDVRLHGMQAEAGATVEAPLFINDLPLPLHVLELKHNFGIHGRCMSRLKAQPELRKLEIDTAYAARDAAGFIEQSPRLKNLQIHRTTMTDTDLQRVFGALPELEVLLVRPRELRMDPVGMHTLRGLRNHGHLRLIILGMHWGELRYEDGLDALATIRSMRQLNLNMPGAALSHPAVQRFHRERPDVLIWIKRETLGGQPGQEREREDTEWNWDRGVTTHG